MNKRSLVLVTVDCLRADHVGFLGYARPVTPFLDSIARESAVFRDAVVAGVPTYFSFPAIMASRYPLALGRDVLGVAPGEPTLATALRGAGHATAAFLAGNPYLSPRFGYDQGFDELHDFLDSPLPTEGQPVTFPSNGHLSGLNRRIEAVSRRTRATAATYDELYFWYCQWRSASDEFSMDSLRRYPAANVIVDQACAWLDALRGRQFFLWLHLMDPHHPYYPPEEALQALGASQMTARRARFLNSFWNRGDIGPSRWRRYRDEILSLYDAGVYWVDQQLSRLVQTLKDLQLWDETVFAVTADHGEGFLEHGSRYHSPTSLPEELIRVPLSIHAPDAAGVNISQPFSLIHLAPTLLGAAGVDRPKSFRGRNCWDQVVTGDLPPETTITECVEACNNPFRVEDRVRPRLLAIRNDEHKLVMYFSQNTGHLYSLKDDPAERSPLPADLHVNERVRLLQMARGHLQNPKGDTEFALRARLREVRQAIAQKTAPVASSAAQTASR